MHWDDVAIAHGGKCGEAEIEKLAPDRRVARGERVTKRTRHVKQNDGVEEREYQRKVQIEHNCAPDSMASDDARTEHDLTDDPRQNAEEHQYSEEESRRTEGGRCLIAKEIGREGNGRGKNGQN